MNMRQLYIFKNVCEERNFTRTAEKLYMTQPAVSHAIADLETEIGCALFDRINKKIYITEIGKLFLEQTLKVLESLETLQANPRGLEEYSPLYIGSSITIASYWLPHIMKQFGERYPNKKVFIEVNQAKIIEEKLRDNKIDIALIEGIADDPKLCIIPFANYKIGIFCANDYPNVENIQSLPDLVKHPLLLREQGSAVRDIFDSMLLLHHLIAKPQWVSVNSQTLIQATKARLGITVLPKLLVEQELREGILREINLSELHLKNDNDLVYHTEKNLSKSMKQFIEFVQNWKDYQK